jgi:hypothetical protein
MRILFDQGTPAPLRRLLVGHQVSTAFEMGWNHLDNGALLAAAEANFDAMITTDQNLRHQQNLAGRSLAVLVLPTTSWSKIQAHSGLVIAGLDALHPGEIIEVTF